MSSIEKIMGLERGERILLEVRRSLWSRFWPLFGAAVLVIGPVFAMYPLFKMGLWGGIIFTFFFIWGLLLFWKIRLCHSNTAFVMTDRRTADIDQKGFIDRTAVEIPYDKIKGVQQMRRNFGDLILGLGDVEVLLSDGKSKIRLTDIRNPKAIASTIMSARRHYLDIGHN